MQINHKMIIIKCQKELNNKEKVQEEYFNNQDKKYVIKEKLLIYFY